MREGPRTVEVPRSQAPAFLEKAEGFLRGAEAALAAGEETSAGALAIHAGISAADALTIRLLGKRSAGQRHLDVLGLLTELPAPGQRPLVSQLRQLLSAKNAVEYDDDLLPRGDGAEMVKLAERIVARARQALR